MKPFDDYPEGGRKFIELITGNNCRNGYGLRFMQITGETKCAYCGEVDFSECYRAWLSMAIDHVIPKSVCKEMGLSHEWTNDCSNLVLACAACNSFNNRYKPPANTQIPQTPEEFFALRDTIFSERTRLITKQHAKEKNEFIKRKWEQKIKPGRVGFLKHHSSCHSREGKRTGLPDQVGQ
jgi:hypothetical protein